jgi:hypothetical protein
MLEGTKQMLRKLEITTFDANVERATVATIALTPTAPFRGVCLLSWDLSESALDRVERTAICVSRGSSTNFIWLKSQRSRGPDMMQVSCLPMGNLRMATLAVMHSTDKVAAAVDGPGLELGIY